MNNNLTTNPLGLVDAKFATDQELADALDAFARDCEQPFFVDTLMQEAAKRLRK